MKKPKLLLLGCTLAFAASSQINQINIVNFSVRNTLPANIDSWLSTPGALMLTAQKVPTPGRIVEPRLVLQIRGGGIACGNNPATARQIDPFDVRTFNTADLTGLLNNCRELKEGSYTICAQFFNVDKVAISREVCREFRVEGVRSAEFAPPVLITPENGKTFTISHLQGPVLLRWTTVVPRPSVPVIYRVRIWQLMQGQNATQAMRANTPVFTKDVDNMTQATVNALLAGPCQPPYLCEFAWNVQAVSRDGKPIGSNNGTSDLWSFRAEARPPAVQETQPPRNLVPENNREFSIEELRKDVRFEWLPVSPKPAEPVRYKLRIWQLREGQTGISAMKNNRPVVEKTVTDVTQTTVSNLASQPCKRPYLCDFVWNVQALNREGKAIGGNNGTSEPTMFSATQYVIQLDSIKVVCTNTPGVYTFSFTLTNVNAGTANLTNLAITSSIPAGAVFGPYAPPLGTGIPSGNQLTITGTLNGAPNLSNICIGAEITDAGNNFWKASKDTCIKVEACRCEACDEKNFMLGLPKPASISWNNNQLSYNQSISVSTTPPKGIKSIEAELVYFEMIPQLADCLPCDKDPRLYGHFTNGTNNQQWTGPQSGLTINITTPNVPCCSTLFRWCIRYKIEFSDCTVCSKVVCYEKKKDGCTTGGSGPANTELNNPK